MGLGMGVVRVPWRLIVCWYPHWHGSVWVTPPSVWCCLVCVLPNPIRMCGFLSVLGLWVSAQTLEAYVCVHRVTCVGAGWCVCSVVVCSRERMPSLAPTGGVITAHCGSHTWDQTDAAYRWHLAHPLACLFIVLTRQPLCQLCTMSCPTSHLPPSLDITTRGPTDTAGAD